MIGSFVLEVRFESATGAAVLRLQRRSRGNGITLALADRLLEALELAQADDSVRAVVIAGGSDWFCSGIDYADHDSLSLGLDQWLHELNRVPGAVRSFGKPTLAVVEGAAVGAGFGLALCCRSIIATETASFIARSPGLGPDFGMSKTLADKLGVRRAAEVLLLNERITAYDAESLGIVDRALCALEIQQHIAGWLNSAE